MSCCVAMTRLTALTPTLRGCGRRTHDAQTSRLSACISVPRRGPAGNHDGRQDPTKPAPLHRQVPAPVFILTASASAFSLETLPPATTDSKAVTQRCLSGKLGASKYRALPGQQVVCGWDSIFSMYGTSGGRDREHGVGSGFPQPHREGRP